MAERNPADLFDDSRASLVERLRRAFSDLHDRQARSEVAIGALQTGQQEAVDSLVSRITTQFSELFTEADVALKAVQTGSFVSAPTTTAASLVEGALLTLTLAPTAPLPFVPSPIVLIGRRSSITDYAIARLEEYEAATHVLKVTVLVAFGVTGPHADLFVEIGALSRLAEADNLLATRDAKDEALAAAGTAVGAASTAVQAAETATSMRQSAQGHALNAGNSADRAKQEADRAQTFNPSNFFLKSETNDRLGVAQVAAAARDQALSILRASEEVLDFDDILSRIGFGDAANEFAIRNLVRSLRHAVITVNPGFRVSQEFPPLTNVGSGQYPADAWQHNNANAGAVAVLYPWQNLQPLASGLVNTLRISTPGPGAGAGVQASINQRVEGIRVASLGWRQAGGSSLTVALLLRSTVGGARKITVAVRRGDAGISYCHPIQLTGNVDFVRFVVPPPPPSDLWTVDTSNGLNISIVEKAPAGVAPTADAWVAGNYVAAPGHEHKEASNTAIDIGAVVLLAGDVPISAGDLPLLIRSQSEETPICQRYYYQLGPSDRRLKFGLVAGFGSNLVLGTARHPHRMRTAPIMTSSPNGTVRLIPGDIAVSSVSFQDISVDDFTFGGSATTTAGASYIMESVSANTAWIAANARI